jgi:ABC-type uncharacterized transport system ATPase subunit
VTAAAELQAERGLRAVQVTKWFGATRANDRVDLHLQPGRIHALLGENGAGKSTLVGVLNGQLLPDEGTIVLNGEVLEPGNQGLALARGIATVHQHLALVPSMTGMENIALALGSSMNKKLRARVKEAQYRFGHTARLDVPVADLELPQRQRIEILRALCQEPAVLILDEPTTFLPPNAVEAFLERTRDLADDGLAVLLITHRLAEARLIADDVTVIRAGKVVGIFDRNKFPSNRELAMAIVGKAVPAPQGSGRTGTKTLLEIRDLILEDRGTKCVDGASLALREGEILGVAGVDGNGQLELLEGIAGLRAASAGSMWYDGSDVTASSFGRRTRLGIHFVSGERRRHGIVPTFTVAEHFAYVLGDRIVRRLDQILAEYGVTPPNPSMLGENLSGGNQQKMILARAFVRRPSVSLLSYPTQGLDVLAAAQLRQLLLDRAATGMGVILASSDLDELLSVSHRVIVMSRGRIVGEQAAGAFDRQLLASWFTTGSS